MDRYLTKTDCKVCPYRSGCFIQRTKNAEEFYESLKSHISYKRGETIVKEGVRVNNILYVRVVPIKINSFSDSCPCKLNTLF